ncbi:MAG TPA: PilZ domain-containing protein [Gammaproteobacteria bacterium]|nr:PilZ domain-containing protein [Gammaproteobacteria bacterium]
MSESEQGAERRRFSRIPFDGAVLLRDQAGKSWHTDLLDISLKGVLVSRPDGWAGEPGETYHLEITLPTGDVTLMMEVETAHVEDSNVGFCCVQIDVDSISHLRRLMELNLGDESQFHRELFALVRKHCA